MKNFKQKIVLALILVGITAFADPLDETYRETFYITTIGDFNTIPSDVNNIYDYKSRLLADNGGVMPDNVKVGFSQSFWTLYGTKGSYYDYIFSETSPGVWLDLSEKANALFGVHMNGTPWGDSSDQSIDRLSNYLEKYNNGEFVQKDRNGNIRVSGKTQTPVENESCGTVDYLEMQLTLSRNATLVQKLFGRNHRMASRLLRWYQKQHPDLIVFNSMSSETHLNNEANEEYCDFSDASKQEYRDWLNGSGFYVGNAQFATIGDYNSAYGTHYASWSALNPPVSTSGSEFDKWHEFRKEQVRQSTQYQFDWSNVGGMSPDKTFGHQVIYYNDSDRRKKAVGDYLSTFALKGGNGVTAYGSNAGNSSLFNTIYGNDKNWGFFEYNPLDSSIADNLTALNNVWNSYGHIICPYRWSGFPTYDIRGSAFETALKQFIANKASSSYTGLKKHEAAPESKDVIWTMSESDDVEASANLTSITFTNGIMYAAATSSAPEISLEIDTGHTIKPEEFYSCSFRICLSNSAGNTGKILWHDNGGSNYETEFITKNGWNVYDINLMENSDWRNKDIDTIKLYPGAGNGSEVKIDWFQLKANHCWNFDDSGEIHNVHNIDSQTFLGSNFSGTDNSGDGYFYFSTDDDRNFIDTKFYKKIHIRMNASANATGQIFWWTRDGVSHSTHNFSVQSGWNDYEIDMSSVANWLGEVTEFRFDPVNANGVSFDIAYFNVSPVMLPPRIVNSDFIVNSPKPILIWDKPVEPEFANVTYSVRLAADTEFTNILFSGSGLTSTSVVYNSAELIDGTYWWQVRADSGSMHSDWVEPMPLFVRAWQFNDLEDSNSQNDFDTPTISDGIWSANSTGTDPYLYFNNGHDRGINADLYKKFCCRVKLSPSSGANNANLYFHKADGWHSTTFNLPIDNQWHIINEDFSNNYDWNDYVDYFRLDPTATSGITVELDYAYFLSGDTGLEIVDLSLPDSEINTFYSYTLSATNVLGTLGNWTIISGSLPAGLSLSNDGVIAGTPTSQGLSTFTVQINDDIEYTTQEFTIEILANILSVYIANPSFAMTNVPGVGYTNIDEWVSSDNVGINPANSGSPFADNGIIPDRKTVAFIQGTGKLSQNVSGLTVNSQYWLQIWYNVREFSADCHITATYPTENDILFVHSNVTAVGSGNSYYFTNVLFIPTVSSGTFSLENLYISGNPDRTALFDAAIIVRKDQYEVIVENPSFEASGQNYYFNNYGYITTFAPEGNIAGWNTYGDVAAGMAWKNSVFAGDTIIPDGKTVLFLKSYTTGGARQDIELSVGNNYNLSYRYNMRPGNSATVSVSAAGTVLHKEYISYAGNNQPFYFTNIGFHADSNIETIQFEIQSTADSSLLIDDVSVKQIVPEPCLFIIYYLSIVIYYLIRKN